MAVMRGGDCATRCECGRTCRHPATLPRYVNPLREHRPKPNGGSSLCSLCLCGDIKRAKPPTRESKNMSPDSKNMSPDSKNMSPDSKNMSLDSKNMSPDSKNLSRDSKNVSRDSKNMSRDSKNMS